MPPVCGVLFWPRFRRLSSPLLIGGQCYNTEVYEKFQGRAENETEQPAAFVLRVLVRADVDFTLPLGGSSEARGGQAQK